MHVLAQKQRLSNRFSKHLRLHERGSRWRYGYLWLCKMKVLADWLLHWQRTHGAFSTCALSRNGQILQNRAKTLAALPSLSHSEVVFVFLARPVLSSKPFVDSSGRTATTLLPHLINTPLQLYTVICDKHSSFNDILRFLFYSYALPFQDNQKQ